MALAEEFRAMTQDIAASFDVRKAEIASIRQQVSDILGDFRKTRLDESKRLNAERKREVSDILGDFRKEREDMASAWHDLVAAMQAKRPAHTTGPRGFSSGEEPAVHRKAKKRKKG